MKTEQLREYLEARGSKDVSKDELYIKRLLSSKTKEKIQRFIKNLTNLYSLNVTIALGTGSYARYDKKVSIVLDASMAYSPEMSYEEMYLRLQGIASHEAAHIIYTNFEQFRSVVEASTKAKISVPEIAKKIDKGNPVFNQELFDAIFKYIHCDKMKIMTNSLEDGAIENAISRDKPSTYGGIVSMRNNIFEEEDKVMKILVNDNPSLMEEIDMMITEMRTLCTIGYRQEIELRLLPMKLKNEDIRLIQWYTLYARLGAKNTLERMAMSEACLDYIKPLIIEKAKEYYDLYIESLTMNPDELLNEMESSIGGHSEFSINSQIDSSMMSMPTPPSTSDYSLDLPQDIQEKINEKIKEKTEQMDESNNGNSGSQNNPQENSENSGTQGDSDSSETKDENSENEIENSEGKNSNSQENENSTENGGGGSEDSNESSEGEAESGEDSNSGTQGNQSDVEYDKHDIETAATEAASAMQKSIEKLKEERKMLDENEFEREVTGKGFGDGKAPKLSSKLSDPSILGDVNAGVPTRYFSPERMDGISHEGSRAKSEQENMNKIASEFAKKVKEILMYQKRNRKKTGLRTGKIHPAGLYRAKTDAKVFKKKTDGHESNARFCVLIDESGSMSGNKMKDAIKAAYILNVACAKIDVPISILGHNTAGDGCELYHYVDYEHFKEKKYQEKIFSANSGGANHDGLALFHSLCDLVRHKQEDEKLVMIVVSDGAPAGIGNYYGEVAYNDIMGTYQKFENEYNVKTIGIGIGNDVQDVPLIYKNNVMVPCVEELSNELLIILKEVMTK